MENKNELSTLSTQELDKILSMAKDKKKELENELKTLNANSKNNFKKNILLTSYASICSATTDYLTFLQTLIIFWGATSINLYLDTNKEVKVERKLRENNYLYGVYKKELDLISTKDNTRKLQLK